MKGFSVSSTALFSSSMLVWGEGTSLLQAHGKPKPAESSASLAFQPREGWVLGCLENPTMEAKP